MFPQTVGLYDPRFETDNCGIGFVTHLSAPPSHEVIERALLSLCNLEHRGALGGDGASGDGAGILTQIPQHFFAQEFAQLSDHATTDSLAVGVFFLPQAEGARQACLEAVEKTLFDLELRRFAWRKVPMNTTLLGEKARQTCPSIQHLLVAKPPHLDDAAFTRQLYLARKRVEATVAKRRLAPATDTFYIASFSNRTMVYKGLMSASQLGQFYSDLQHADFCSSVAVFHQRYSTNTFPAWPRAQPFRALCHNGEINTLQGNFNWTLARESALESKWGEDSRWLKPVIDRTGSDSAMLDNVVELLVHSGRSLPHALLMLVPEAWEGQAAMDEERRAFHAYHAGLSEPWDGPAALTFCDGRVVGTVLDRNGLRPVRYAVTSDGWVASASEDGAVPLEETSIVKRGKLGPGQMLLVDLQNKTLWEDGQLKRHYAKRQPYADWLKEHAREIFQVDAGAIGTVPDDDLARWQQGFGYTAEDISLILRPMANTGHEPVGSMGDDTPPAALSAKTHSLYRFFKQRFAQVTNPAIDSLREARVMSLSVRLGKRLSYLEETAEHGRLLKLSSPILHRAQWLKLQQTAQEMKLNLTTLSTTFPVDQGNGQPATMLASALRGLALDAERAVRNGASLLALSDQLQNEKQAPIPALLALGTVHHHLIKTGVRTQTSLIVVCGDAREVHHVACLIGCGAEAVFPYLALDSARALAKVNKVQCEPAQAVSHTVKALEKGLLKTMAKMGIATVSGYHGAQVFQTLGLHQQVIQQCFTGISARLGNVGIDSIARDVLRRHRLAYQSDSLSLPNKGLYRFKRDGERHAFTPASVRTLHQAVKTGAAAFTANATLERATQSDAFCEGFQLYRAFSAPLSASGKDGNPLAIRDLLAFHSDRKPISLEQVEPIEAIVKRFSTGAMSHGSLSDEAHRALGVAMNRLGAASNSGEGGEHPNRFETLENSRIKQVASGRFGVTAAYLSSADELQIKIAQGAKPGEGGQLPGHKVSAEIAAIRHTSPGVALISPPPHHDIYSIEDLAQLIYDLKRVNPAARVSVKLVAETGVGVIAAGVAKGYADVVHIAGHSGGTGSSPLNSIKNAGEPWELGLAETQQTLVLNDLRGRVRLRTDGGLQTGRDVIIAAMLGADEFSFGTSSLVALGCLMARQCHANTCPVGIATQDIKLREKFLGQPEALMAYMSFIAHEVRQRLASLGYRTLEETVGRSDLLHPSASPQDTPVDLDKVLARVDQNGRARSAQQPRNDPPPRRTLDDQVFQDARDALHRDGVARLRYHIRNTDRSVGVRLAGAAARCAGPQGLVEDAIECTFTGCAGGSFGAFAPNGLKLVLVGAANDYVGKGLCGGKIVLMPHKDCLYRDQAHEHTILGNTALYGATGGALFAAGLAGERFAVRNSGAVAVVEGLGAHGCEYMTGGAVVILGPVGDNFAAGMTGGVAYVFDEKTFLGQRYNPELVQLQRVKLREDIDRLKTFIADHQAATDSARAAWILDRWDETLPKFWKVAPLGDAAQIEAANEGTEGKTRAT